MVDGYLPIAGPLQGTAGEVGRLSRRDTSVHTHGTDRRPAVPGRFAESSDHLEGTALAAAQSGV